LTSEDMGKVCFEDMGKEFGTVYDKPYEPNTGKARRGIGRWFISSRWYGRFGTPMASFRIMFDSGHLATARRRTDIEGCTRAKSAAGRWDEVKEVKGLARELYT
jgi:hypothetical protein